MPSQLSCNKQHQPFAQNTSPVAVGGHTTPTNWRHVLISRARSEGATDIGRPLTEAWHSTSVSPRSPEDRLAANDWQSDRDDSRALHDTSRRGGRRRAHDSLAATDAVWPPAQRDPTNGTGHNQPPQHAGDTPVRERRRFLGPRVAAHLSFARCEPSVLAGSKLTIRSMQKSTMNLSHFWIHEFPAVSGTPRSGSVHRQRTAPRPAGRERYRVVALVARRPPEPDPVFADPVIAFIDGVVEAERVLL